MTTEQPWMKPTITIQQANKQAEDYAGRVFNAVFPGVKIEPGLAQTQGDCSDPTDGGPTNRLLASRSYELKGLDPATYPAKFDAMRSWWAGNGFVVSSDKANGSDRIAGAEQKVDGFGMSLRSNNAGGLFVNVSSPCVWPKGTPEPQS